MDKVVHFEIPFEDKQRAMKFYTDSFGWQLADMPQMNYVMASTVDVDQNHMPKEAANPTIYVGVQSVESAIKKVEAAGGKVVTPKTPIPGMGAYARIADTEGNVLSLFEAQ